jgi:hypothetical protein
MKKKKITKKQMIDDLVEDDIQSITLYSEQGEIEYLANILEFGFKGYSNYTLEELQAEHKERFE